MSRTQLSSIDKANFYQLKPQSLNVFQTFKKQANSKQDLRDQIMDYIIQKLFKENHKDKSKLYKSSLANPYPKKIPITLNVEINGVKRTIQANGYYVLEKYIEFEKKNLYRQHNIEPLVVDILNFFDEIHEVSESMNFEISQDIDLPTTVINILLEKYHKDRQKLNRIKELNMVKSKTVAKYTRVSYLDIQNGLEKKQCQIFVEKSPESSHRVSRDTISSSVIEKLSTQTKEIKSSKFKLKDLVDNYKVFLHPQKVEKLRAQKLKEIYDPKQIEKATDQIRKENFPNSSQTKSKDPNQEYLRFLQDWITDISISEKLFKDKMQQKEVKQKQSQVHVAKIIEESEDEEFEEIKLKSERKSPPNQFKIQTKKIDLK